MKKGDDEREPRLVGKEKPSTNISDHKKEEEWKV